MAQTLQICIDSRPCRILIVGAGPTALGAMYRLQQLQQQQIIPEHVECRVLEQELVVGGLARSVMDENGFCWDLGVHVMGISKYPDFVDALTHCVPTWKHVPRCAMVYMAHVMSDNNEEVAAAASATDFYVPYPVQNSIPYFPVPLKQQCMKELTGSGGSDNTADSKVQQKTAEATATSIPCGQDFDAFSLALFGPTLQHIFIRPYNEKVWTVRLAEMGTSWLQGRVPLIDTAQLARRCALPRAELMAEDRRRQTAFRYPAECRGVGEMWRRFAERFSPDAIQLGQRVIAVDPHGKFVQTIPVGANGKEEEEQQPAEPTVLSYDLLISTIPLTELGRISGLAPELPLQHSTVILVGIGLCGGQSDFIRQLSWAYYPRPEIIFYRCTVLSNFSPEMVPTRGNFHDFIDMQSCPSTSTGNDSFTDGRGEACGSSSSNNNNSRNPYWSVLCEIGQSAEAEMPNGEQQRSDIVQHVIHDLIKVGVLCPHQSDVCSTWVKCLPFGYPIPTLNRDNVLAECHALLEQHQIFSRGRFGGWRYEISNQDHSFQIGLELIDQLFLGIPETVHNNGK